jgi:DNA (cytosine-5)-methyltransferase 1
MSSFFRDSFPNIFQIYIFCIFKQALKSSGCSYSFTLYNAANFGSPQVRERVIIICSRDLDRVPFLEPTHSENGEFDLPRWKTFKQAVRGIKENHHVNFPDKRLKYYRMLESGQNWRSLPQEIQKEALGKSFFAGGGKTGFLRRLAWNKPSPTLVTHPAMPATDLAHPTEDRPLSIEEYKRVQEFRDEWEIAGPLVQQYKQVGNAVPAGLGKVVGLLIQNILNAKDIWNPTGFPYSRYKKTSHCEWEKEFESRITIAKSPKQAELAFV